MPKLGGRIKGTPNKRTLELAKSFKDLGFDLVSETMKEIALIDKPAKKAELLLRMWPFIYPTRKPQGDPELNEAVDVTPIGPSEASTEELVAALEGPRTGRKG